MVAVQKNGDGGGVLELQKTPYTDLFLRIYALRRSGWKRLACVLAYLSLPRIGQIKQSGD